MLIAALSLPFWLTALPLLKIRLLFLFIYSSALSAYYFQSIEHVGRGAPGLPFASAPSTRWELALAFARGLVGFGVGYGPALVGVFLLRDNWALLLLLLLFGICITPAVILSIVLTGHTRNGLWPLAWWAVAKHDLRAYGKLVGQFVLSCVAAVLFLLLVSFTIGYIPLIGAYFSGVAITVGALVQASLVGHWVRQNVWTDEALRPEPVETITPDRA